jgi:hypothetical protein
VSTGNPLGPTLADIIMTELENIVIKPLLTSGTLKFFSRYVDDTLVLSKPSDIPLILLKLNYFDAQIQCTHEIFTNDNDVHFLDIIFTPSGTPVYSKSTHIGQYVHLTTILDKTSATLSIT